MRRVYSISSSIAKLGFVRRTRISSTFRFSARQFCDRSPKPQGSVIDAGLLARYKEFVGEGKLQHDPYQERVAIELEKLLGRLEQYERDMEEYHAKLTKWEEDRENERRKLMRNEAEQKQDGGKQSSKLLERWIFGIFFSLRKRPENVEPGVGKWVSYLNRERKLDSLVGRRPTTPAAPKGLYIYGNVGSGKTMLMDMFYGATAGVVKHRRRFHFHEAMLNINEHMHEIWKNQVEEKPFRSSVSSWIMNLPFDIKIKEWLAAEEKYKKDMQMKHILPAVADKFLIDQQTGQKGASILCFDEIQTIDVFAIVALSGILGRLLATGTVLVATSNRAPKDLNQDDMQREIFHKLLTKIEEHCETILIGSEIDYRRFAAQRCENQVTYFWPLESSALNQYEKMWSQVTEQLGGRITSVTIPVMFGRKLKVPESCKGVARFPFEHLCGRPLGAADYIAVTRNYHTVFISDIPAMSMRIRDKARRFITLVDELYNHHCCLVCSASASIEDLFHGTEEGTLFDLESFQFETDIEGGKLRRDVLAEGKLGDRGAPSTIISMMSGREESFAFRRAVSRLIEMQTPLYQEGVRTLHPYFQGQVGYGSPSTSRPRVST
ncbi:AFG1-like ATPase [Linum perenne]